MRGRFRFRVGGAGGAGEVPFSVRIVESCVNTLNQANVTLRITGVEIGQTVDWSVTDGVGNVSNTETITAVPQIITGVDLSSLNDGTLTISGLNNNTSDTSTSTKTKDTVSPSGYAVDLLNQNISFTQISTLARLNFTGLEIGSVVSWRVTDNVLNVTGSFTASGTTETIENVDVSSLADGSIRSLVILTDACGNAGSEEPSSVKTKDTVVPSGYASTWRESNINNQNETNAEIDFSVLEVGATAFVIITSDAGGTPITDDFVVSNTIETHFYDVSSLPNGTLTVSLVLVDVAGNVGAPVTDTIEKQVDTPSGYSIAWNEASYDETTGLAASATVTGANVGNTYYFEITSSGGGTPITGSGTVASSSFQIIEDITSLSSGTGTIEYYEVDTFGNVGGDVSDTATFDLTVPLLLDLYPNAACAYSVRKLRTAYTGAAIRVRRDTDNAEQDIGFVNNELDTASLLAFVGAGSGFVTIWYDQSGNNRHMTQASASNQLVIVLSGVLLAENSIPCLSTLTANTRGMQSASFIVPQPATKFLVIKNTQLSTNQAIWGSIDTNARHQVGLSITNNGEITLFAGAGFNPADPNKQNMLNKYALVFSRFDSFNSAIGVNGNALAVGFSGVQSNDGSSLPISFGFRGIYQELLYWGTDETTNRTAIESNINGYYNIYP